MRVRVTGPGPVRTEVLHVPRDQSEQGARRVSSHCPFTLLLLQQSHQEGDVAHGQPQDLVLTQLLLGWVGRDELPQLRERRVHVVLPPALTRVSEHLPGHDEVGMMLEKSERQWFTSTNHHLLTIIYLKLILSFITTYSPAALAICLVFNMITHKKVSEHTMHSSLFTVLQKCRLVRVPMQTPVHG